MGSRILAPCTFHDSHKLCNLPPLLVAIAAGDGVLHAVADVIGKDFLFNALQGGAYGRELSDDVDAIAVFLHHFGYAANLPLDTVEAFEARCLAIWLHERYIPRMGMNIKRTGQAMTNVQSDTAVTCGCGGMTANLHTPAVEADPAPAKTCCGRQDQSTRLSIWTPG